MVSPWSFRESIKWSPSSPLFSVTPPDGAACLCAGSGRRRTRAVECDCDQSWPSPPTVSQARAIPSDPQVLVKGMQRVLSSCLRGWLSACLGELSGLLQDCRFIFRPPSPPLAASLGSQLLITCTQAARGANPRSRATEVTPSALPLVISNPPASADSCRMPPVNYSDHGPAAVAAALRTGSGGRSLIGGCVVRDRWRAWLATDSPAPRDQALIVDGLPGAPTRLPPSVLERRLIRRLMT